MAGPRSGPAGAPLGARDASPRRRAPWGARSQPSRARPTGHAIPARFDPPMPRQDLAPAWGRSTTAGPRTRDDLPNMPHGRPTRLPDYNYSRPGGYFVTVVVEGRRELLGRLTESCVELSPVGTLVEVALTQLRQRRPWISIESHVVMPDHLHAALSWSTTPTNRRDTSLGHCVSQLKGLATREVRRAGLLHAWETLWMSGFWEVILRGPAHLERARAYILENPSRAWSRGSRHRAP
mgnify:CR=1 FL=1